MEYPTLEERNFEYQVKKSVLAKYGYQPEQIGEIPADVKEYMQTEIGFFLTKKAFEILYNAEDDKGRAIKNMKRACTMAIGLLNINIVNPFANKKLNEFKLQGWLDIKEFVKLFGDDIKETKDKASAADEHKSKTTRHSFSTETDDKNRLADLRSGVTVDEVREILSSVDKLYTKSGEVAAAFRALHTAGVLVGNAPEVLRWAIKQGYAKEQMLETFKKSWTKDVTEANQLTDDNQKTVFRNVLAGAEYLLKIKRR